jgi:hypothetical protein
VYSNRLIPFLHKTLLPLIVRSLKFVILRKLSQVGDVVPFDFQPSTVNFISPPT